MYTCCVSLWSLKNSAACTTSLAQSIINSIRPCKVFYHEDGGSISLRKYVPSSQIPAFTSRKAVIISNYCHKSPKYFKYKLLLHNKRPEFLFSFQRQFLSYKYAYKIDDMSSFATLAKRMSVLLAVLVRCYCTFVCLLCLVFFETVLCGAVRIQFMRDVMRGV
jgi:hypothetical protein